MQTNSQILVPRYNAAEEPWNRINNYIYITEHLLSGDFYVGSSHCREQDAHDHPYVGSGKWPEQMLALGQWKHLKKTVLVEHIGCRKAAYNLEIKLIYAGFTFDGSQNLGQGRPPKGQEKRVLKDPCWHEAVAQDIAELQHIGVVSNAESLSSRVYFGKQLRAAPLDIDTICLLHHTFNNKQTPAKRTDVINALRQRARELMNEEEQ